jgi:shikimate kinase
MYQKIFLVGFMCSGKTVAGALLAKKMNVAFVDTDSLIEELSGMKVQDIFSTWGEKYFRRMERYVLYGLLQRQESFVCATGGGAVCQIDIMDWLNKVGTTIWLDTEWNVILDRLSQDTTRPLARLPLPELKTLFEERKKYYLKASRRVSGHLELLEEL